MKITTGWLEEQEACSAGVRWFGAQTETDGLAVVGGLIAAFNEEKLRWANWLIVRLMDHDQQIRYAVFAAEKVLHIFEDKYPNDKRPRLAIEAVKKYLADKTENNRDAAWAAGDAAWAAVGDAARDATRDAARDATRAAAEAAAWEARAGDAAWAAAVAAGDAARAAGAAGDAARRKMLTDIVEHGIELIGGTK